jgi:hypothetical protein
MDNSDLFNNTIKTTNVNDAYKYSSHSSYINSERFHQSKFSTACIFCNYTETIPLMTDGSFRSCKKCNKMFKAKFI